MNFSFVSCIVIGYLFSHTNSYPTDQKDNLISPSFKLVTTTIKIKILYILAFFKEDSNTTGLLLFTQLANSF